MVRCKAIVRIDEDKALAPSQLDSPVASSPRSAVELAHHTDAAISGGSRLQELERVVRRPIVHENDLKVREGLAENRVEALLEVGTGVIDGRDHRQLGHSALPRARGIERRDAGHGKIVLAKGTGLVPVECRVRLADGRPNAEELGKQKLLYLV